MNEQSDIVQQQIQETVRQTMAGVIGRLMTVTCPCGRERGITLVYRCLYCDVYFCKECAEDHFGKTVDEYRADPDQSHSSPESGDGELTERIGKTYE